MRFLNVDEIHSLVNQSLTEGVAFTMADKGHFATLVLPFLRQRKTPHDMAGADMGSRIRSDEELFHVFDKPRVLYIASALRQSSSVSISWTRYRGRTTGMAS